MDPKGRGPATASLSIEPFAALDWNGSYLREAEGRGRLQAVVANRDAAESCYNNPE
jgi:hypothetical protein